MKFWSSVAVAMSVACFSAGVTMAADSVHEFKAKSIDGKEVDLKEYKGKVLLIVNVASECGLTPQYEQLQALHEKYGDKGLVVIGFPCNQFGGQVRLCSPNKPVIRAFTNRCYSHGVAVTQQEPGSSADIAEFFRLKYPLTFPVMEKIDVNGDDTHPVYAYLKSQVAVFVCCSSRV